MFQLFKTENSLDFFHSVEKFALMVKKFRKILIANRGEIAARIIRSCQKLGIRTVLAHSSADRDTPAAKWADETVEIGPPEASQSYLNVERIVSACKKTGYGFLSENASLARRLVEEGIVFIGPTPDAMEKMGNKIAARKIAERHGVPVLPGYEGGEQDDEALLRGAKTVGFPVLIKAAAGGGGRGMRLVSGEPGFTEAAQSARREALAAFGDGTLFIEKYVQNPRHIEIQVFGDREGNVAHLFERDCSIQRRRQKVIEESPGPTISEDTRQKMTRAALALARAVGYHGAGTVEFVYSDADSGFYFLEMNTRLQVEHPVTEMITGIDLVEEQIHVAAGSPLSFRQEDVKLSGHAVEARLYAEDPGNNFMPSSGALHRFFIPSLPGLRVDSGVESGNQISIYYDPMIAKIIAHGTTRTQALDLLDRALAETICFGPVNNLDFLRAIVRHETFRSGQFSTNFIDEHLSDAKNSTANELSRTTAALLHYNGAKNFVPSEQKPGIWAEMAGYRLWK